MLNNGAFFEGGWQIKKLSLSLQVQDLKCSHGFEQRRDGTVSRRRPLTVVGRINGKRRCEVLIVNLGILPHQPED